MTINASSAGAQFRVSGTTNLPDGARVVINAWRAFRQLRGPVRVANVGGLVGFVKARVNSGRFTGTISMVKEVLDPQGLLPEQGPVAAVAPDVNACAEFMTGRDLPGSPWYQPDPAVRAAVGSFGEHLRGSPEVRVFGSLTKHPSLFLDVSTRVPVPTSTILQQIASLQSQTAAVKPLAGFCPL